MKFIRLILACLLIGAALAAEPAVHPHAASPTAGTTMHRYLVERTFPAGALAGLNAATKAQVNARNASVGVRWVKSYATADKTKTFCVYEGPSEQAIRKAAALNHLPVDRVIEIPVTLLPR
jgi:Nickel responsive protein SCO4226-like